MTWRETWERGDPAKVYERREAGRQKRERQDLKVDPFGALWKKGVQVMTREESDQIEELLMTWFYWAKADRPQLGYSRVSPGFQSADTSEIYDDHDDREAKLNRYVGEQVDVCMGTLPVDLKAAVGLHTANCAAGNSVFRSPRWTREEHHQKYQQAKLMLLPELRRRNLVKIAA